MAGRVGGDGVGKSAAAKFQAAIDGVLCSVSTELVHDSLHLEAIENANFPERECRAVFAGEVFDFARKRQGTVQIRPERNDAVIGEQAGQAAGQRLYGGGRQLLGSKGVVGRAANIGPTGHRDHVMECGNPAAGTGETGRLR